MKMGMYVVRHLFLLSITVEYFKNYVNILKVPLFCLQASIMVTNKTNITSAKQILAPRCDCGKIKTKIIIIPIIMHPKMIE